MAQQMIAGNSTLPAPPADQVNFRPIPRSIDATGLPKVFLANLVLKHFFYKAVFTVPDLIGLLKISYSIIMELLDYLNREKFVEILGSDPLGPSALGLSFRYTLTNGGKRRAEHLLEYDAYVGPAPVTLEDYWDQVGRQTLKFADVTPEGMQKALQDLVISRDLLENLGVAAVNGKSLFLYGPPGNGKT